MTIREMLSDDIGRALAFWRGTPGMGLRSLDDTEAGIAAFLRRNPGLSFVAETDDGVLVGAILCGHDGRRGSLYHLAVAQAARGQGVGRALAEAALDALRGEGIKKASLVVFRNNENGNAFWEAIGFRSRDDLCYRDRVLDEMNV